jgi:hypothetical protein
MAFVPVTVELLVKVKLLPAQVVNCVKAGTGLLLTVSEAVNECTQPLALVEISVGVYTPGLVYVCGGGACRVLVTLFAKFQAQDSAFEERLVKVVVRLLQPVTGLKEKEETGEGTTFTTVETVSRQEPVALGIKAVRNTV